MSEEEELAKAAGEIAKTASKVIDASREFGGFVSRFISGPLEQGVGIFKDKLTYMRWERQVRLMKRAEEFLASQGLSGPTRALPLKIAVPLFQAASLEDDDYLQDLWAKLLVNGATGESGVALNRVYIDILERLTPLEARILENIYSTPFERLKHQSIATAELPNAVRIVTEAELNTLDEPPDEVKLAIANLARMGCIGFKTTWGGGQVFSSVVPTLLGSSFVAACTLRQEK